jgi:hypothetical protein
MKIKRLASKSSARTPRSSSLGYPFVSESVPEFGCPSPPPNTLSYAGRFALWKRQSETPPLSSSVARLSAPRLGRLRTCRRRHAAPPRLHALRQSSMSAGKRWARHGVHRARARRDGRTHGARCCARLIPPVRAHTSQPGLEGSVGDGPHWHAPGAPPRVCGPRGGSAVGSTSAYNGRVSLCVVRAAAKPTVARRSESRGPQSVGRSPTIEGRVVTPGAHAELVVAGCMRIGVIEHSVPCYALVWTGRALRRDTVSACRV